MMRWTKWCFHDARGWDRLAILWLALTAIAVVFVFEDFGTTFDEDKHVTYGDMILAWFTSGFEDRRALTYDRDYLYGGAYDLAGAIVRALLPLKTYDAMHLLGGMVGWLGLLGSWRLGRRLGGPAIGCVALLLVSVMPTFVGHAFSNPKDAPFAVGYVWALLAIVDLVLCAPNLRWTRWLSVGVLVGLSASVRIAGLLSFCYLGIAVVFVFLYGRRHGRFVTVPDFARLVGGATLSITVSWLAMIAAWPWAQLQPLRRPVFVVSYMSKFMLAPRRLPFDGEQVYCFEVPWDYIPRLLLYKLPELVWVGVVLALLVALALCRHRTDVRRIAAWAVIVFSVVFPPVYAIVKGSSLYGGLRHFLFVQPPLAILAASGIVIAPRLLRARAPRLAVGMVLVLVAMMAWSIRTVARLHPMQYVYYNQIAGGLPGVERRFEIDYYGAGYRPGIEHFLAELWDREPDTYLQPTVRYAGCGGGAYLPANFVKDPKNPDFRIGSTRGACRDKHRSRPVFSALVRDGVPIVIVRDLRSPSKSNP
jgi:hypothetical protein